MKQLLLLSFALLCVKLGFAQVPSYVPTNGLVGYWGFNGNANDLSGNGYNLSNQGATLTTDRNGLSSTAYAFTGSAGNGVTGAYMSIPNLNLNSMSNYTINIWVYEQNVLGDGESFISFGGDVGGAIQIFRNGYNLPNSGAGLLGYNCGGSQNFTTSSLLQNQWVMYTISYSNSIMKAYINSNLIGTFTNTTPLNVSNTCNYIARHSWGTTSTQTSTRFNGKLDDISIYNRAITQQEVTALYTGIAAPTSSCLPNYVPTNGLVGYWPFCGNANDESGNGNNGTVNGATLTTDRNGNANSAYSFNGSSDFINILNSPSLQFNGGLTISTWVNANTLPSPVSYFLSKGADGGTPNSWNGLVTNSQLAGVSIYDNIGLNNIYITSNSSTVSTNTWVNIVFTFDGGNEAKCYINGQLANTAPFSYTTFSNAYDIKIGKRYITGLPYYWHGKIDDVAIYNRAITQQEVNSLYTGIAAPTTSCLPNYVPTNGLVGYWPFCGNANDESGNGNNGNVNGATLTTDRNGNTNSAYSFNGTNNYIQLPNNTQITPPNITVNFWFKILSNNINQRLIRQRGYGYDVGYNMQVQHGTAATNKLNSTIYTNSTSLYDPILNSFSNNQQWHQFTFSYDSLNYKVYLDSVLVYQNQSNGSGAVYYNNLGNGFTIGRDGDNPDWYFNGEFDDMGIWNRALSKQEIKNLYLGTTCVPPVATITPASATTFCTGGSVILNANTDTSFSYQWLKNNTLITGATTASYTATTTGSYSVIISNGTNCSDTSAATVVTVNTNPSATIAAMGATTFCSGGSVMLSSNSGTGFTYVWKKNGTAITGATSSTYSATISGTYNVQVSNSNGCSSTSTSVTVTVNPSPTATLTASGATTFCTGGSVVLNANTGTGLIYTWKKNNTAISGATSASYTATTQGSYVVVVTGTNGCSATSTPTTVTVNPLPTVTLAPLPAFICLQAPAINLNGTPTGGTYSGQGISGNTFTPTTAGLGNTTVTYNYTNANNCSSSASQSTIVYDTTGSVCTTYDTITTLLTVTDTLVINAVLTGLIAPNNQNTIKVFPNPTSDHITINYGNYALMNGYTLRIENALGQVVFTSPINLPSSYVDLSSWTGNGIYFVKIINPSGAVTENRKIVLQ
jgi:hypothetical protein